MKRIDYLKVWNEYPKAHQLLLDEGVGTTQKIRKLYNFFDDNGVRVYTSYGASGGTVPTVYRRRTEREFKKEHPNKSMDVNWKMVRIGIIQSYSTREEAEISGFMEAFKQLEFLLNNLKSYEN